MATGVATADPQAKNLLAKMELPGYAQGVLASSALLDVSTTSVKNIPYVFFSKEMEINDLTNFATARISFGEAALRSLVSAVYNLVFATVFTAVAVATLGQAKGVNNAMQKYWIHAGLGAASSAAATAGVIIPKAGVMATGGLLAISAKYVIHSAEKDIIAQVQDLFKEHKDKVSAKLPPNVDVNDLEARVLNMKTFTDLFALAGEVYSKIQQAS